MNPDGQNYWQGDDAEGGLSPAVTPPLADPAAPEVGAEPVSWEASEYIHHQKDFLWFAGFLAIAAVLVALSIFLIKSWTFTALIVVMAVAVIVFALRPPRTLRYTISRQGLQINEKAYSMHDFRAFGVVQDGPLYSIILIPTKRFMPSVSLYFPQELGERIVDTLGSLVPMETVKLDAIDRLVRKLRF